jgi:hypothetical protein
VRSHIKLQRVCRCAACSPDPGSARGPLWDVQFHSNTACKCHCASLCPLRLSRASRLRSDVSPRPTIRNEGRRPGEMSFNVVFCWCYNHPLTYKHGRCFVVYYAQPTLRTLYERVLFELFVAIVIRKSVNQTVWVTDWLTNYLSIYLSIYISIYICLSVCLSVCPFVYPPTYLPTFLPIYKIPIYPGIHPTKPNNHPSVRPTAQLPTEITRRRGILPRS